VARAAGYFEKWLLKWPDVQSLAAATLDEVSWALLMFSVHWKVLQQALQTEHVCCCSFMLTSYSWSCLAQVRGYWLYRG